MEMNIFIIMICAYTGFTMFLKRITTEDNFTGFQKFDNNSHIVNNEYSHLHHLTYQQCNIKNQYVYDQQTLLLFNEQVKIKILPQTVKLIRSLRLQRKWKHKQRGKGAGRNTEKKIKKAEINIDNIIWIKCIPTQEFTKNVSFFTTNCRPTLKSGRDTQVRNFMIEESIDFGVLTETWFQDVTENWKLCDLNIYPLKLNQVNRCEGKRGGGIALVFKQHLKVF